MKLIGTAFRSTLFKGYASTYIVEFFVLVSNLLVYKLCTQYFGNDGLTDISIFKRIFSFIQPILLFGLLIGITRFVAQSSGKKEQFQYFFTTFSFFLLIGIFLLFLMNLFSTFWTEVFFDDLYFEKYILPLSVSLAGIYFHFIIYGYLRGKLSFLRANCLQFISMALVPIFAFFVGNTLSEVLLYTGLAWTIISTVSFIIICLDQRLEYSFSLDLLKLKSMLKYGLPRVPGDIAFGGLFALPIILVSHFQSSEIAGRLAFSLTLLNIVGAAFSPLSLMLLPTISQKLKDQNFSGAHKEIKRAIKITLFLSSLGVYVYEVFAEEILVLYLGVEILPWVKDTQIIMLGGIFYALFITLRSVIDAYHEQAVNSVNLIISVLVFCIGAIVIGWYKLEFIYFYTVFLLSLLVLVVLTLVAIFKIQKKLKNKLPQWEV